MESKSIFVLNAQTKEGKPIQGVTPSAVYHGDLSKAIEMTLSACPDCVIIVSSLPLYELPK